MELITEVINMWNTNGVTLYLPVALLILGVILVFMFGFHTAEQPPFDKLTDSRKLFGKKRKTKEKKVSINGHINTGETKRDKSVSKRSPAKDTALVSEPQKQKDNKNKVDSNSSKHVDKNKKNDLLKHNKSIEDVNIKVKKNNMKKHQNEKPLDFDDGNWEMVPSKGDKKKKAEQSPVVVKKNEKKIKKNDKMIEIEKLVKDVLNKDLREKEKEIKTEKNVELVMELAKKTNDQESTVVVDDNNKVIEEKNYKKKEKKVKELAGTDKIAESLIDDDASTKAQLIQAIEDVTNKKVDDIGSTPSKGGPIFDELGDIWTDAKAVKKSKKKARREN